MMIISKRCSNIVPKYYHHNVIIASYNTYYYLLLQYPLKSDVNTKSVTIIRTQHTTTTTTNKNNKRSSLSLLLQQRQYQKQQHNQQRSLSSSSSTSVMKQQQQQQQQQKSQSMHDEQVVLEQKQQRKLASSLLSNSIIHRTGEHPYGSRKYMFLRLRLDDGEEEEEEEEENIQRHNDNDEEKVDTRTTKKESIILNGNIYEIISSLSSYRNVIFGAKVHYENKDTTIPASLMMSLLCQPLLSIAVNDCSMNGEQVQSLSTLYGLNNYIQLCYIQYYNKINGIYRSNTLDTLFQQLESHYYNNNKNDDIYIQRLLNNSLPWWWRNNHNHNDDDQLLNMKENNIQQHSAATSTIHPLLLLESIYAIATGIPRYGTTNIGIKTHNDTSHIWSQLAKEYVMLSKEQQPTAIDISQYNNRLILSNEINNNNSIIIGSEECYLYSNYNNNVQLIDIELLADKSSDYLRQAGGSMARFFFL